MLILLGAICMTLDHVGLLWSNPWLRLVGRFAFPLFAYQIVISYHHSKSVPRYIGRLLLCAVVSQPIYSLMCPGAANVLFLFTAAVCALCMWDSLCASPLSTSRGYLAFAAFMGVLFILLLHFRVDYGPFGLLVVLLIAAAQKDKLLLALGYTTLTMLVCTFGILSWSQMIGVLPLFLSLDHLRRIFYWKYAFYVFYPAHMAILLALKSPFMNTVIVKLIS